MCCTHLFMAIFTRAQGYWCMHSPVRPTLYRCCAGASRNPDERRA